MNAKTAAGHRWSFFRCGGVNQVRIRNAADLAALGDLDPKLWVALAMPRSGTALDPETFDRLDTDGDGTLRPPEIVAAVRWTLGALNDPGILFSPGDAVPLSALRDPGLADCARKLLGEQGRPEAGEIRLREVAERVRAFENSPWNGDGVVPPASAESGEDARAIGEILSVLPGATDRSGARGLDAATLERFFEEAGAWCDWEDRRDPDSAAAAAVERIRAKAEDFFARCRLAAFDPRAAEALWPQAAEYRTLAGRGLEGSVGAAAELPLAPVAPGAPLPLSGPVNPAWAGALAALGSEAFEPLLGGARDGPLSEADWTALKDRVAAPAGWLAGKPETPVAALGGARLRELRAGDCRDRLAALIGRDAAGREERGRLGALEKLVRFRRDLLEVLTNTVNFAGFYGPTQAVFQAGTLYLDARACSLCVEVTDPARHASLAGLSGAFLAYCDLARPGGRKRQIVAAVTNGDSDNLMAGRNGIFYDREGLDWNATLTRVVSNPISVREAFWLPYKRLVRMIEDQIAKRAQAADTASTEKLSDAALRKAAEPAAPAAPGAPGRRMDLGTIALIGTAIGGISALVGGFLQVLFGLGFWLPLGILGLLLLISGPSMLLASMKLRKRNLGPLLDAGGWAINTKARINIPFGASLTRMAELPRGSARPEADPFSDPRRARALLGILLALAVLALFWSRRESFRGGPPPPSGIPASVPAP